jgi:hypothetical protein
MHDKPITLQTHMTVQATLECPHCLRETTHDVHYVAGLLHWVKCQQCGLRWEVSHRNLELNYMQKLPIRLATKPMRMGYELQNHPWDFFKQLTFRVLSKPVRIAKELAEIIGWIED